MQITVYAPTEYQDKPKMCFISQKNTLYTVQYLDNQKNQWPILCNQSNPFVFRFVGLDSLFACSVFGWVNLS